MRTFGRFLPCLLLPLMAACSGSSSSTSVVGPTAQRCAVTVSAPASPIGPEGGTGTISVDTARECQWSASAEATWLTIMSGATGQGTSTVPFSAAPNRSTSSRRGTIAVNGQRAEITQEAANCSASVSPTTLNVRAAGDSDIRVAVTEQEFCAWTAVARVSWIAVTSSGNGTGNGEVRLSVAANTGPERSGSVDIAGREVVITQAAVPAQCTFAIAPASLSTGAAGDSATVNVTASPNCAWAAISEDPWIEVRAGASGVGNGTVTLQVASNSGAARTGRVTIAGRTYTVTQSAAPSSQCTFTVAPESVPAGAAGGPASVAVTTGSDCSWSVSTSESWITFAGGSNRTGSGTVQLTIASNPASARTGNVSIAGRTVSVEQAGAPAASCSFSINPTSASPPAGGGSTTVAITTTSGCTWTTTGAPSWITVTDGSGTGTGSVTLAVQANTGAARTATLTIAGQSFVVTQAAGSTCSYSINPTSASPAAAGGSTTVAVTTTSECAWTTTGAPSWITVTGGSGTGNGSVALAVEPNTGGTRTATLTIAEQSFVVNQVGTGATCSYSLAPTGASPTAEGGSTTVAVTTSSGCAWTTTGAPSWITVTDGSGTGTGSVTLAVQPNTGTARTATLTIAGQSFVVTQAAAACSFIVTPTITTVGAAATTVTFTVTTASHCTWTASVTTGGSFLNITSVSSGTGDGAVAVRVDRNRTSAARSGTLTIAGSVVTINQEP